MQKLCLKLICLIFFMSLFCCTQDKMGKQDILATINDSEISIKEFEEQLAQDLNQNDDVTLSKEKKSYNHY